ncbi:hypothetical protein SEVIR_5G148950v4 [Setaria viridis]
MKAVEVRKSRMSSSATPKLEFWPLHTNPAASPSCADELFAGRVVLLLPKSTSSATTDASCRRAGPLSSPWRLGVLTALYRQSVARGSSTAMSSVASTRN